MAESDQSTTKKRWMRTVKLLVRLTILAVVCWGIWRALDKALVDLREQDFQLSQIRSGWLVLAGAIYLVGMLPCWAFWRRTLHAMGQQPGCYASFRAYYIGHLGKYVPGKALVVILRTGLIRGPRVDTTVAATSVFVETLTMMAVGSFVAAAVLGTLHQDQFWPMLLAVGLMVCAGVPTLPPIFRRLVRVAGVKKMNPEIDHALAGLDLRLMIYGWVTVAVGWGVLGLSLWATLRAIPETTLHPVEWAHLLADWPLTTACVALALVAGFLSLLPGGVGIREWVIMTLLAGPFGAGAAAVSAILLRVAWLGAEFALAAIVYLIRPPEADQAS